MSQDPIQTTAPTFAEMTEAAARAKRFFPYGGFEDLDSTQLQILVSVAAVADRSPGEIARSLAMEKSSVSEPLARLGRQGLVQAGAKVDDGRRRTLRLTAKGSETADRYVEMLRKTYLDEVG